MALAEFKGTALLAFDSEEQIIVGWDGISIYLCSKYVVSHF